MGDLEKGNEPKSKLVYLIEESKHQVGAFNNGLMLARPGSEFGQAFWAFLRYSRPPTTGTSAHTVWRADH